MKAILIQKEENMMGLFLCNGKVKTLEGLKGVIEFLTSYNDKSHYEGNEWDFELKKEDFDEDILFAVTKEDELVFYNQKFLNSLLAYRDPEEFVLLPAAQYAEEHGKKSGAVRKHCRNGKIPSASFTGREWLIPKNAPYPKDGRYKETDE